MGAANHYQETIYSKRNRHKEGGDTGTDVKHIQSIELCVVCQTLVGKEVTCVCLCVCLFVCLFVYRISLLVKKSCKIFIFRMLHPHSNLYCKVTSTYLLTERNIYCYYVSMVTYNFNC
jgi:hypothetical protein